jgi:hypothetical protein
MTRQLPARNPVDRLLGIPGPIVWPPGSVQDIAGRKLLGALPRHDGWTAGEDDNPDAPLTAQHITEPGYFRFCLWAGVCWSCGTTSDDPGTWTWFVSDDRRDSPTRGRFVARSEGDYADVDEAMTAAEAALAELTKPEL